MGLQMTSARKQSPSPGVIEVRKPPSKRIVLAIPPTESDDTDTIHMAPTPSSRPTRSTRALPAPPLPSAPVNPVLIPYIEPYYPPTTESGKPALVEATERRFVAIQNAEKVKEMQDKQKESVGGKNGQPVDSTRSGRRSRTETMLPFGVVSPRMLGWKMDVSR
jgi:hypothetical protein